MPELLEVIPGTFFLLAPVLVLIFNNVFPWTTILALIGVLAIPLGWLSFNFEGFYLIWKGRYEDTPPYRHIRERIEVVEKPGEIVVNLQKVLPKDFQIKKVICSDKSEYEVLFDPFKKLTKMGFFEKIFGIPYRKIQPKRYKERYKDKTKPFYVENVQDITFFSYPAFASYIREQTKYWHILRASFYGSLWGLLFAVGLLALIWSNFLCSNAVILVVFLKVLGLLICAIPLIILSLTSYEYSMLRRNEALAHEHLLIKLKIAE